MKQMVAAVMMAMAILLGISAQANATAKYVEMGKVPTLSGDTVDIGNVPAGYTLTDVVVYDDVRGIPGHTAEEGAKTTFKLEPGEGFNFVVKHPDGKEYFQMITPRAQAGKGIWIDCPAEVGCKYYRPMPNEQPPAAQR
jgi:hypothetical protein